MDSTRRHSGREQAPDPSAYAESIGYREEELKSVPEGARETHGCGNPTALAELGEGETVLDLGCGGGLDVFLAARKIGGSGRVIGVDAAPDMIAKARANAKAGGWTNVEFKAAGMERLPLPDASVDAVISNCVINHAADKLAVFREAYRVLKPGGRMLVADLVTTVRLPETVLAKVGKLWREWLAVASTKREYLSAIEEAGFRSMTVIAEGLFPMAEADRLLKGRIVSIQLRGRKP